MRRLSAAAALVGCALMTQVGCSTGDVLPAAPQLLVLEPSASPRICDEPCGCMGVGAYWSLHLPDATIVSVEATVVCGLQETGSVAVLIEPLDDPCALSVVSLRMTDYLGEVGVFAGMVDTGGRPARLTVVQSQSLPSPDCPAGPGGCIDLGVQRKALSESVEMRRAAHELP